MISDNDNEDFYFLRVSDEIIRYKQIFNFFFNKESFLQFEKVGYNLNEEEIILLEDLLINRYFDDIVPLKKSKHVKVKNIYDTSIPNKHIAISNKYSLEETNDFYETSRCILLENEIH